jgi:hypothetical protein
VTDPNPWPQTSVYWGVSLKERKVPSAPLKGPEGGGVEAHSSASRLSRGSGGLGAWALSRGLGVWGCPDSEPAGCVRGLEASVARGLRVSSDPACRGSGFEGLAALTP